MKFNFPRIIQKRFSELECYNLAFDLCKYILDNGGTPELYQIVAFNKDKSNGIIIHSLLFYEGDFIDIFGIWDYTDELENHWNKYCLLSKTLVKDGFINCKVEKSEIDIIKDVKRHYRKKKYDKFNSYESFYAHKIGYILFHNYKIQKYVENIERKKLYILNNIEYGILGIFNTYELMKESFNKLPKNIKSKTKKEISYIIENSDIIDLTFNRDNFLSVQDSFDYINNRNFFREHEDIDDKMFDAWIKDEIL